MNELAWFVAGAVVAAMVAALWPRRRPPAASPQRAPAAAVRTPAPPQPAPPPPKAAAVERVARPPKTAEARTVAATVAEQLASLTSGVEGNAQLLIEAAADPAQVARNAERFWHSVQRLRRFHDKLDAYVHSPPAAAGSTALPALLSGLRQELAQGQLGLMLAAHLPKGLPLLQGAPATLHRALLGLCAALRHLERGAERLSVSAEPEFDGDHPTVQLELHLECDEEPSTHSHAPDLPAFELELGAAQNLLYSVGGSVQVMHQRGKQAQALLQLRVAADGAAAAGEAIDEPVVEIPQPTHPYAGVLLIEDDPEVRALLASELKACGRSVFACPDSVAARTLLAATPERFELLIVDRDAQLEARSPLALAAAELCPELKLCVVSSGDGSSRELPGRVHRIRKPFGVLELRAALKTALSDRADPAVAEGGGDAVQAQPEP